MNPTIAPRPSYPTAHVSLLALTLLFAGVARAAEEPLHPQLEKFRPFLGKTWRGEFKNSTPEKPIVDVSRWERALNGQAVRVLHSVNQGEYGGETLIFWNEEKKSLAYHYVTTAGFQTSGTMTFDGTRFSSLEKVTGQAGGITEVRATGEIRSDGTLLVKSEYHKGGNWVPGRETVYHESPEAQVVFR
jgi:hypothetical protein